MKARLTRHALLAALVMAGALAPLPASADRGLHMRGAFPAPGGRIYAPFPRMRAHGHYNSHWNGWWFVGAPLLLYPPTIYTYPQTVVQPEPIVMPDLPPVPQSWYYCDSTQSYYPYAQNCAEGWRTVPAAPPGGTQAAPTGGQNWYYCDSARGYYPYVQRCPENWRPVAPTPPSAAQAPEGVRQP